MSPVAVAADSTTYLPRELASREGVTVLIGDCRQAAVEPRHQQGRLK